MNEVAFFHALIKRPGYRTDLLRTWLIHRGSPSAPMDHVHGLDAREEDSSAPKRLESEHKVCDFLDCPVILLNRIVEIFALTQFNSNAGIFIEAANGSCVGATFIDSDFLRQTMQIDGPLWWA